MDTPMKEKRIGGIESKENFLAGLEVFALENIREHLRVLLEREISEWLGRDKEELL